ncbi:MAG: CPBP family intramembrane glutamic endopeptidase [Eubacteriales bacterium]
MTGNCITADNTVNDISGAPSDFVVNPAYILTNYTDSEKPFFNSATYYLTESSNTDVKDVQINILDDNGRDLDGVTIIIKAAIDGTYTQVEELVTDINGELVASLDTSKRHLFEISRSGYQNKSFFINEPLGTAYTFTINDLVQVDFENELDGVLYSYDPGKGVLIYNRSYVFNWTVSSPTNDLTSLYASRFIIREYNSTGDLQATYVNTSTNTSGELLTLNLDLSSKINSTIEFIFCFQKQGFSEYCLSKKLTVLPQRVSASNLYGIRDYVADNYSEGQRIMMWLMAWVITSIIFAAIPFMRNILIVVPVMLTGLFFGWLFLPIVYLTIISVFLVLVLGLLVVRSNV